MSFQVLQVETSSFGLAAKPFGIAIVDVIGVSTPNPLLSGFECYGDFSTIASHLFKASPIDSVEFWSKLNAAKAETGPPNQSST